jgi:hypothetical protein
MDRNIKRDIETVIEALAFCEKEGKSCKKCKSLEKDCLIFMRSSIAVCLKLLLNHKVVKDDLYS